jgi:hypothetical protein
MSAKSESKKAEQTRWGRIRDLPVSKSLVERLIREGLIESYAPLTTGSKRAPRLINMDSFDRWVRGECASKRAKPA